MIPSVPSTYTAANITYSNTSSGLAATTAQAAIDELSTMLSATLVAGNTTVTFSNAKIKTTSVIDPYIWTEAGVTTDIIAPTAINVSNGSCTLTFPAQSANVTVGIRVFK